MTNDTAQVPARKRYCRTNEQVRADILSAIGRILRERRGGGTCSVRKRPRQYGRLTLRQFRNAALLIWEITDVTTTTRRASANRETHSREVCETYSRKFAEAATLSGRLFRC